MHLIISFRETGKKFFYVKAKNIFDNPLKPKKNHSAENILPLAFELLGEHNRVSLSSAKNLFG